MALSLSTKLQDYFTYGPVASLFLERRSRIPEQSYLGYDPELEQEVNSSDTLSDPNSWIGIEIEVEGISAFDNFPIKQIPGLHFWDVVNDGSLKDKGKEFVSVPLKGPSIPLALHSLNQWLKLFQKGHKFSSRCGTHIHIGCRYMTIEQLVRFILLYLVTENVFYDQAGEVRKHNNFCVPLGESFISLGLPDLFYRLESQDAQGIITSFSSNWKKYSAFNLLPLIEKGTIEFRHYSGTSNPEFLIRQINLIQSLRKFAIKNSTETIKQFILSLNTTSEYNHFLDHVLGISEYYSSTHLKVLMEERVRQAKELISYVPFAKKVTTNFKDSQFCKVLGISFELSQNKAIDTLLQKYNDGDINGDTNLMIFNSIMHENNKTALKSLEKKFRFL